ncbi:MAG: ABC transporter ATP-binding protein [Oscillibacter sp.]|nr:ABC transporter ATP-binding protein [Oscillibacter sp.]
MKRNKRTPAAREYFRAFYEKNRLHFTAGITFTALSLVVNLSVSWILGAVLDTIAAGDLERLRFIFRFVLGLLVCNAVLDLGCYSSRAVFIHQAMEQYKSLAFRRLSAKSISAFSQENTGRYLSTLTNDAAAIETDYLENSFTLLMHVLLCAGSLAMMCWYSPLMTALSVLLCIPSLVLAVVSGGPMAKRAKAVSDQNEGFMAQVKDLLSGFSVIKSFKAEKEAQKLFDAANHTVEDTKRRRRYFDGYVRDLSGCFGIIFQFGIFLTGAYLAIRGDITAGTVVVFVNLSGILVNGIGAIPQYWASRKAAAALVEKLAEVTAENAGRSGEAIPARLDDAITLDHVTFGYKPDEPVLKDLSMRLEAGKKYALVGASGSGKSTLLNLLMGAYDGYSGSIAIDGRELREVNPDSLYDVMSLIGQNVFLFDDTLYQNITMFRDFPEDKLELAVHRSGLDEVIERKGESCRCGENGGGLSGGERQRVSIARCLLRETPVLLLDEATAALDNQTAFSVTDAILHLDGLTRVVVTHRLEEALLEQYDGIFVLRGGRVCEEGRFADLMEKKEYFYSLYTVANG